MTNRIPVGVFFALFTISGFAGLIYQSIWSHYLKLFLGHAAYAQTLVLAIFMGGMAIGSWLVSRYTHRLRNLLMGYAFAELGIGLLAVVFHGVFVGVTNWAYASVLPALGGSGGIDLFKWTLASLLILPASILLGTTFPLMSAGIIRLYPDSSGKALSMLYFTNSFGAAVGVLVSGFYLIDQFGLPGTILTAGLMNVVLAIVVWAITKALPAAQVPRAESSDAANASHSALRRAILILALATGAASFIYEITWIRMLTLGLGASTHAFEVMLAAFILGMSLGALMLRNRIGKLANDLGWLSGLLVAKALFAVYAVWVYDDILTFLVWVMQSVSRTDGGYILTTGAGLVASMAVMLPTAICAGMTLPLATHALTSRGMGEASIGKVYGANTAGCILGAAFSTHLGMEAFGVKGLTGVGAVLDVAVAVLVLAVAVRGRGSIRAFAGVAIAVVAGAVAFSAIELDQVRMSSGIFRYGQFYDAKDTKVLYYRDGKTSTISVLDRNGMRTILTNGKPDAGVIFHPARPPAQDEGTMLMAGALPLAIKPRAVDIANIGFGSGLTTHTLLGSPHVKQVDSVEIEPAMVAGARLFAPRNSRAYDDPRSKIHYEDAKTFFAANRKRYDIIVSEPSNPWISGVSTLFSEEFYSQIKHYLKDDGILVQWIQVYEMDVGLLSTVFNALDKHFPDYVVYTPTIGDLIVIATPSGKIPPLSADVFKLPGTAEDLVHLGYRTVGDMEALRIGNRAVLSPFFADQGYPANSDYFPIIDQRGPRSRFKKETADDLRRGRDMLVPFLAMMDTEYRSPLARISEVDRHRPARLVSTIGGAEAMGIFLTGKAAMATFLSQEGRVIASLGHSLLQDCSGAPTEWTDAVQEVMRLSTPYISRDEVRPIFDRIEASKCWKQLDTANRRRILLYKAINERDAEGMRVNAEGLLEKLEPKLETERALYLLAAMTGNLVQGRRKEALDLWTLHEPRLTAVNRQHVVTRIAVSHARRAGK